MTFRPPPPPARADGPGKWPGPMAPAHPGPWPGPVARAQGPGPMGPWPGPMARARAQARRIIVANSANSSANAATLFCDIPFFMKI